MFDLFRGNASKSLFMVHTLSTANILIAQADSSAQNPFVFHTGGFVMGLLIAFIQKMNNNVMSTHVLVSLNTCNCR